MASSSTCTRVETVSVFTLTHQVSLPDIPELYDSNFLDVLIPASTVSEFVVVDRAATPTPRNPMIDALNATSHQAFTSNGAPAYSSTSSATLDAFNGLTSYTYGQAVEEYLNNSWRHDPELTLRLIWNIRSIHDGKGERETFYRAFGWLYDNHPRTAISNLHLLVEPVCVAPKGKKSMAHGYWKDLLNILCLAVCDELSNVSEPPKFLHSPRMKFTYARCNKPAPIGTPASRIEAARISNQKGKAAAKLAREAKLVQFHERLTGKLSQPKFRALYIAVARLFSDQLLKDIKVLGEINSLAPGEDRIPLMKKISLAGKWAPTPGGSHDRVTNIATAISQLVYASQAISAYPCALDTPLSPHARASVLRSFYQRWILTELRRISACPEPLMSSNRWTEIRYNRVPSICMKINTPHFFKNDPKGFEGYLISVESGRSKISGATLLPHELVAQVVSLYADATKNQTEKGEKSSALKEFRKSLAETQLRVVEAQWKTLIESLRDSGSLENSLAVCDVSGSMGSIMGKYNKDHVPPILPAISLSLVLSALTKPPFNGGFITFSASPRYERIDVTRSLLDQVYSMRSQDWGMNTDLNAVFLDLLLPLAVANDVKQEDMIKCLFIFTDMQFDQCDETSANITNWKTNYDAIEKAYQEAGYDVPQIVYWDLAAQGTGRTVEVEGDRKGVAMMNGFSPALLKVFMGEEVMDMEWEQVSEDGTTSMSVEEEEEEYTPVNVMKRVLLQSSYDRLVVVD
ncbi:hypothetical protein B0H34DRAFT_653995 [Crassisporium funariophilum]|nr:hypothetical protein B0H34DRAFT_653995 [Crassisporium funariophilum]